MIPLQSDWCMTGCLACSVWTGDFVYRFYWDHLTERPSLPRKRNGKGAGAAEPTDVAAASQHLIICLDMKTCICLCVLCTFTHLRASSLYQARSRGREIILKLQTYTFKHRLTPTSINQWINQLSVSKQTHLLEVICTQLNCNSKQIL